MLLQLFFSLLILQVIGLESGNFTRYVRLSERKIETTYLKDVLIVQSKIECSTLCTRDQNCDKYAWNSFMKRCQIAKEYSDGWAIFNSKLESASEWTSYERIKYSVSTYIGPFGRNTMSFQEAVETCIAMGTTIASRQMLLKARAEGFGNCACGWLADGSVGYVMQYFKTDCWSQDTSGIHDCYHRSFAEVYCSVQ